MENPHLKNNRMLVRWLTYWRLTCSLTMWVYQRVIPGLQKDFLQYPPILILYLLQKHHLSALPPLHPQAFDPHLFCHMPEKDPNRFIEIEGKWVSLGKNVCDLCIYIYSQIHAYIHTTQVWKKPGSPDANELVEKILDNKRISGRFLYVCMCIYIYINP